MEPMTGIEPAYSAWEADVLPLNYIGVPARPVIRKISTASLGHPNRRPSSDDDNFHETVPGQRVANTAVWLGSSRAALRS